MTARTVTIASIVEGPGDVAALPRLLHRLAADEPGVTLITPTPWRQNRGTLLAPGGIERATTSIARRVSPSGGVLVLLDADDDCPASLAPALLTRARSARPDLPLSVVLAAREFELWFLAAASSLAGQLGFVEQLQGPSNPEIVRGAKEWLTHHRQDSQPYKPTADQAALTSIFDIKQARDRSRSFEKLCREIQFLIAPGKTPS